MMISGWRRPRLLTSALVMVAAISAIGLIRFAFEPLPLLDLRAHLDGAAGWLHGQDPYLGAIQDPTAGSRPGSGFVYPPYCLLFFAALDQLHGVALLVWQLAQLASLGWLVFALAAPRTPRRIAVLTIMAVAFYPVITNIVLGQVGLLMLAALWAALPLSERRREKMAGLLLALGGLFKVFPLVMVIGFAIRRQWQACVVATVSVAGVVLATLPWVGQYWSTYLTSVLVTKAATATTFGDAQSIVSAAIRAFPQAVSMAHVAGLVIAGCVLMAAFILAGSIANRNPALGWALPLAALPLTMPHAWQHYYVLSLPLLWMVVVSGYESGDWWLLSAAGIAYACLSPLALTIDYWGEPISRVLGGTQGLYLNCSVIGGSVLLFGGGRLALAQPRERAVAAHGEPQAA